MTIRRYRHAGSAALIDPDLHVPRAAVQDRSDLETATASFGLGPLTFVVDLDGTIWIAPRQAEHVQVAGGRDVLSAGEIEFDDDLEHLVYVSNQSTGYCPEPSSYEVVAVALQETGLLVPDEFIQAIVFRRCTDCGLVNLVKDDWFICSMCDADLPTQWNV